MTVIPIERRGVVVGEQKHKECCVVGEGGQQERCGGTVDCRKVLGEKGRSWTRMTCFNTRRVARKRKGLHHAILGRTRRGGSKAQVLAPCDSVLLEVSSSFVLLEYCLGVL